MTPEEETLAGAWLAYLSDITKPGKVASEESIRDQQTAFCCGAMAAYWLTLNCCLPDDESLAEAKLKALSLEIDEIDKALRSGK